MGLVMILIGAALGWVASRMSKGGARIFIAACAAANLLAAASLYVSDSPLMYRLGPNDGRLEAIRR